MGRFRFLTAGESHGKGLISIVEGMVAGLPLEAEYIDKELRRRQGGYGRSSRMQMEEDKAEIISGIYHGITTGNPIALFIPNRDWREIRQDWQEGRIDTAQVRQRLVELFKAGLKSIGYRYVSDLEPAQGATPPFYHLIWASSEANRIKMLEAAWNRPRYLPCEMFYDSQSAEVV